MTGQSKRRRSKAASLADVIALIGALSQRGAQLRRGDGVVAAEVVSATGNVLLTPTAAVVAEAQRRAWIGPKGEAGSSALTAEGRRALKKARSRRAEARAQQAPTSTRLPQHNPRESPLAWLASRQDGDGRAMLTDAQLAAGERLRVELTLAALTPRVTMSWSGVPGPSGRGGGSDIGQEMADTVVAARARVTLALRAVGPEAAGILIDVCGHLRGLEEIARTAGWPKRSARLVLQQALSALARHYGLAPQVDIERLIGQRLRHWGAADYRPRIDGSSRGIPDQED